MSHPTGVRGLKSPFSGWIVVCGPVAPHWGAWIEILRASCTRSYVRVAPHWGAWIEISIGPRIVIAINQSHPTGVRGLKFFPAVTIDVILWSHPTGVRGLKCLDFC